jgi:alcohol dehydrogenase class IV
MKMSKMSQFAWALVSHKYRRAVEKNGAKYPSHEAAYEALMEEVGKLKSAMDQDQTPEQHGVREEAAQVAAVCMKIIDGTMRRREGNG